LLNQLKKDTEEEQPEASSSSYLEEVSQAYNKAAEDYLTRFSNQAFATLRQYEELGEKIINSAVTEAPLKLTTQHHQLQFLQTLLDNLNQELEYVRVRFTV